MARTPAARARITTNDLNGASDGHLPGGAASSSFCGRMSAFGSTRFMQSCIIGSKFSKLQLPRGVGGPSPTSSTITLKVTRVKYNA